MVATTYRPMEQPWEHDYYVNVSVMGLRAYVEDKALIKALVPYGDNKGEVIRLKYEADHELAGLENGNRLVRMILNKPSIHYSLKIGDEWCRIIHMWACVINKDFIHSGSVGLI